MAGDAYVLIMAGGGGTRLWPASRKRRPKQFLPLLAEGEGARSHSGHARSDGGHARSDGGHARSDGGHARGDGAHDGDDDSARTLLGATVARVQGLVPPERILVVTAADQVDDVVRTAPSVPRDNIVIEPEARNTAACIGLGALEVLRRDPAGVLAVLPSDQYVQNADGYRATLERAIDVARGGAIVTIGIVPTHPETGFGYLELGQETERGARVVERFVEKPDLDKARRYLADKRHLWNSGMFIFSAKRLLEAVRVHLPELANILDLIAHEPFRVGELYPKAPAISIDYGVMEKLPRGDVFVVPGEFGWNDVGSWSALGALRSPDAHGNVAAGAHVTVDARGNILYAEGKRLIAAVGVHDLVIVATDDAVLVLPKERAQDVREVVDALKKTNRKEFL